MAWPLNRQQCEQRTEGSPADDQSLPAVWTALLFQNHTSDWPLGSIFLVQDPPPFLPSQRLGTEGYSASKLTM